MNHLKSQIYNLAQFEDFSQKLNTTRHLHLNGLAGSLRAFISAFVLEKLSRPLLYVAADLDSAERMRDDLELLLGKNHVAFLPALKFEPYDEQEPSPSLISLRIEAMEKLAANALWAAVTFPRGLAESLPEVKNFNNLTLRLRTGQTIAFDQILHLFTEMGLKREDMVQNVGEFSVRGGVVDFFAWNHEDPLRLEFFGNQIESIRRFDIFSQRSVKTLDEVVILPHLSSSGTAGSFLHQLLPRNTMFFLEDEAVIVEQLNHVQEQARERYLTAKSENRFYEEPQKLYLPAGEWQKALADFTVCESNLLAATGLPTIHFKSQPHPDFGGSTKRFLQYVSKQSVRPDATQIVIQCSSEEQAERLQDIMDEEEIPFRGRFMLQALHGGFNLPGVRLEILTDHEIFNRFKRRRTYRRFKSGEYLRQLSSLNLNDYVVHVDYGIGRYLGMEKIDYGASTKECIKIGYRDGDFLYVTVDRLNRVQKYSSEGGGAPRLTKLGSHEWERTKNKTKESLKKVAAELIRIYAARKAQEGHRFAGDSHWQKELEATFLYEETPDQMEAIIRVKEDMENEQPMDRLLCGDVGFGKTEVALRAAFKAVMDGKQAAILAPTTILAFQHYETFRQRMQEFPVVVEMLTRFRTAKEQKRILQELAEGKVDIVIGTHRLLSNDVRFKDLGLLVVDEEQRFGVRHKEKLKQYRLSVDILSMTATPIPRTLHMALMGARDLSNIDTPPANRLPVHTEIINWDDNRLRQVILRELKRGGQVYFVHNRVETIETLKEVLKQIVPRARIAVGHGQLPERRLEQVMLDFMHKKYDVLLATMIIENGLDIPNVNTIIINRADKFGLSQLYQLRGRVGRSNEQAYAYLIVPPMERISDTARKRLRAIQDFTELGSGYKVALRDLEIRGAGNLLGKEQSGFVQSVGFDLYCKILDEAVKELKQGGISAELPAEAPLVTDAKLDVDYDLFIPEQYIPAELERITVYHRLVNFSELSQVEELRAELEDRFGKYPPEVERFLITIELKILSGKLYAARLILKGEVLKIIFSAEAQQDEAFFQQIIPRLMEQKIAKVRFLDQKDLAVQITLVGREQAQRLSFAKKILQSIVVNS